MALVVSSHTSSFKLQLSSSGIQPQQFIFVTSQWPWRFLHTTFVRWYTAPAIHFSHQASTHHLWDFGFLTDGYVPQRLSPQFFVNPYLSSSTRHHPPSSPILQVLVCHNPSTGNNKSTCWDSWAFLINFSPVTSHFFTFTFVPSSVSNLFFNQRFNIIFSSTRQHLSLSIPINSIILSTSLSHFNFLHQSSSYCPPRLHQYVLLTPYPRHQRLPLPFIISHLLFPLYLISLLLLCLHIVYHPPLSIFDSSYNASYLSFFPLLHANTAGIVHSFPGPFQLFPPVLSFALFLSQLV